MVKAEAEARLQVRTGFRHLHNSVCSIFVKKILSTQTWWKLDCVEGCCISRGRERFACVAVGVDHMRYGAHMFAK